MTAMGWNGTSARLEGVERVKAQIRRLLPGDAPELSDSSNLIECGLDSLHILRLVNEWRREGIDVTFAELVEEPLLGRWLELRAARQRAPLPGKQAAGASLASCAPAARASSAEPAARTEPAVPGAALDAEAPFGLTDVQQAYWIGRADDQPLGGVGCHAYLELDGTELAVERLQASWRRLFVHHPMLRAEFSDAGQRIPSKIPEPELRVHDLRALSVDERRRALAETRARLSHRRLGVERGEVIGLELSSLPDGAHRLHLDLDLLVADVQSLHVLLRDLARGCAGAAPAADPSWSFGAYLARESERRAAEERRAQRYWEERVTTLPEGPRLPIDASRVRAAPVFRRKERRLEPALWQRLRDRAKGHGLTPATVLACAYAEVLARWSESPRFVINVPLFDRNADQPGIEEVVADFTNLILLECDHSESLPFVERASRLARRLHSDMAHSRYSAVRVQRDLARRSRRPGVVAPVVFACNLGTPLLDDTARQVLGELTYMISQTPQVWLDHQVYELEGGLLLAWDAVEDLFEPGVVDAMFTEYGAQLERLAGAGEAWGEQVRGALPAAQRTVRERANATGREQRPRALHADFFERARREPGRVALIEGAGAQRCTYGELARRALGVAALLRKAGAEPGDAVAVSLRRGMGQIVAVLGVLAAGCCYVPVGVHQPAARRAKMYRTAGVRLALVDVRSEEGERTRAQARAASASEAAVRELTLEDAAAVERQAAPVLGDAESVAYVIFTSGSTGEPKGVEVTHGAAVNTIDDVNRRYGVNEGSRVLAVSSLDFDLSVYDVFGLLGAGGSVVLVREEERRDATAWLRAVHEHGVTLWNSVPVLLEMLLVVAEAEAQEPSGERRLPFEQVLLSGDWIGLTLPERLKRRASERTRLYAMGGATEAAIWSNVCEVKLPLPEHWRSIPYGKPLANQRYRVVDAQGRDCPDWVAGELWIGGAGVAKGYRGDAALTRERFVEHAGERWYRTGDRGRYWSDGTLEFLGREDQQVKVRGHRIELGEIEAALAVLPGVRRAVAVTMGEPPALAAAVELSPGAASAEGELAERLREQVPEYMVPSLLQVVEQLPLSDNGKVDRKRLSAELSGKLASRGAEREPPRDDLERQVAEIWREVLRSGPLSRDDDFFQLGGDSLGATRIVQLLRQRRVSAGRVPLRVLFSAPTIATLSDLIRAERARQDSSSEAESALAEEGVL